MPEKAKRMGDGMDPITSRRLWIYSALYCGFVLLIHIAGGSNYLHQVEGRQGVIIETLRTSPRLALQFAGHAVAIIVLNLLPLALLLLSLRCSAPVRVRLAASAFTQFLVAVVCLWLVILCFNKLYFPRSSFAVLIPFDERAELMWAGGIALAVYGFLGLAPAFAWIAARLLGLGRGPGPRLALGGVLAFGGIPTLYSHWAAPAVSHTDRPDIIIIGMDSVSPLHLQRHPGKLPIIERFLSQSTVFEQNITPLARTFPAWTSILTARYPVHNGARFNLTAFDQVETQATLPNFLKASGYRSIYAQDERQFNNIDETFGFDKVVGPAAGAADLVLSKAADQPLANLALLTPWAETLLPFVALNRAANVQYDPDVFVAAITDALPKDRNEPLLLVTHFCLAHLPYAWRDNMPSAKDASTPLEGRHIQALQRLEQQMDSLLQGLKKAGRLDNAIVVLLSDHGEALGYSDGLWPSVAPHSHPQDVFEAGRYTVFRRAGLTGHGTNTLDRTEYQSVLAFRGFGRQRGLFAPGRQDRITSLVDVSPTLMAALGQTPLPGVDGVDLRAATPERNTRAVTAETGIRFQSVASIDKVDESALLKESRMYYEVDPASARLVLRKKAYPELVAGKDIAVHTDDWMLALLRQDGNPYFARAAILVHKPSGAWTVGKNQALIKRAPMTMLTRTLRQQYGGELADFVGSWPFTHAPGGDT